MALSAEHSRAGLPEATPQHHGAGRQPHRRVQDILQCRLQGTLPQPRAPALTQPQRGPGQDHGRPQGHLRVSLQPRGREAPAEDHLHHARAAGGQDGQPEQQRVQVPQAVPDVRQGQERARALRGLPQHGGAVWHAAGRRLAAGAVHGVRPRGHRLPGVPRPGQAPYGQGLLLAVRQRRGRVSGEGGGGGGAGAGGVRAEEVRPPLERAAARADRV
mmetsp:Transcript_27476/g.69891  ORF Transcript_27476/g.69891 Transcript_27476/m.69891 type:complete len:216 (-) Transcript_27476:661-1308(-)